ncbi:dharma isoform X2 [Lepisosteus oculatus]|uniref:dharma isoform X2 n=1 Tax=Lepisosteus oculatus TaxID=7918 RepID=UPI0037200845
MGFNQRGCPYGSGYSVCHCGSYAGYGSWSYALPDSGATAGPADGDLGGKQRRRWRTVFTRSQTEQLERVFGRADYPSPQEREELARRLGLSEEAVRVWFKNRRARKKRQGHRQKPSGEPAGAASAQSPPGPPGLRSDKENHPGLSQT